jgi:hypothetical protein
MNVYSDFAIPAFESYITIVPYLAYSLILRNFISCLGYAAYKPLLTLT